jgi:XTP/dITP diphosphohydrolase
MRKVVIASDNRGKLAEIRQLLAGLPFAVVSQAQCGIAAVEETASTFRDNALQKARHASASAGLPAIADDSGLEVDALHGEPGVYSARFAGHAATDRQNVDKLLAELGQVEEPYRGARFRCVAVYVEAADDPSPLVAEGVWAGRILEDRRGVGGFGYDPVFYDPELGRSAAEMGAVEKNLVSHRGKAFRQLAILLAAREGAA